MNALAKTSRWARPRRRAGEAGRAKYHRLFNGARVLRYMVETLLGQPYSESYEWADEVYR